MLEVAYFVSTLSNLPSIADKSSDVQVSDTTDDATCTKACTIKTKRKSNDFPFYYNMVIIYFFSPVAVATLFMFWLHSWLIVDFSIFK